MECSVCGADIPGEPASRFLIRSKNEGEPVILAMRTCGKPVCYSITVGAFTAAMELGAAGESEVGINV